MSKYEIWYAAITKRGQIRELDSDNDNEIHHIIPKSLGGSNNISNLTSLTTREHFICHWLLTKIHREGEAHWKMINALRFMRAENANQKRYSNKITARVYSKLKKEYSALQSERMMGKNNPLYGKPRTEKAKTKISEANTGRVQPINEKLKQKAAQTGRKREPFNDVWLENMAKAKIGSKNHMYGKTHNESTVEIIRQKATGRKQSAETIAKKAEATRGTKREKKQCPHCHKDVAVNGYARWHGDNCKKL